LSLSPWDTPSSNASHLLERSAIGTPVSLGLIVDPGKIGTSELCENIRTKSLNFNVMLYLGSLEGKSLRSTINIEASLLKE
jgi:hypothetical protein